MGNELTTVFLGAAVSAAIRQATEFTFRAGVRNGMKGPVVGDFDDALRLARRLIHDALAVDRSAEGVMVSEPSRLSEPQRLLGKAAREGA